MKIFKLCVDREVNESTIQDINKHHQKVKDMNTQTIAAQAQNKRKMSKNSTFLELLTVIDYIDESTVSIGARDALVNLYCYFSAEPAAKKVRTAFEWVRKAQAIEDVRYYLNGVYVDDDYITATDGHRLHRVNNNGLGSGYYDSNAVKYASADDVRFPNVEQLFKPVGDVWVDVSFEYSKLPVTDKINSKGKINKRVRIGGHHYQKRYIDDMLSFYPHDQVTIKIDKDGKLWFSWTLEDGREAEALVMPIRD